MTTQESPIVWNDPLDIDQQLERLGLTREIIERAVFTSEYYRDQRTDNDAPGAQGWIAYTWCVRAFRENTIPIGWERRNDQNRALTVSPNGRVSVAIVIGDEGTGRIDMIPDVGSPKGEATKRAVFNNQPTLLGIEWNAPVVNSPVEGPQSWFLLRRRTDDSVYIELSLPASIIDGHVEGWLERIVLGRYPYESTFNIEEDFDSSETIDIPIFRQA